ncbi:zinc ribbon domain-containing protein [Catellatospora sp. NPDC049111]|uniref:zinc ribbon domain-containing protein n=1 Tax=Catellatospora sp. NPDC049111 TaxID=3155271 RepID=UPI00340456CE
MSPSRTSSPCKQSGPPRPANGERRVYLLAGLMQCGFCGRRMDAHWVNHRPGYRCRHGHTSAKPADLTRLGNLYVREDETLAYLSAQLARLGADLNQHSLVRQLREQRMTIICDGHDWILSTEVENLRVPSAKIPDQRRPDRLF